MEGRGQFAMIGTIILGNWLILTIKVHGSSSFRLEFDDYDSVQATKYPCFGVGTRCDMTPECCRPATCALPAWSLSPVCLVPGYKQLLDDFEANSLARIKDILRIKQLYNITYFDHLLAALPTSPPLKEDGIESSVNSTSKDSFEYNGMESKSNYTDYNEYGNLSTYTITPNLQEAMMTTSPVSSDYLNTPIELNSTLKQFSDHLKNQVKLLIINSSVGSKNITGNIIPKFNNTDRFKEVVILLEEKLKLLNQNQSMTEKDLSVSDPSTSTTIQPTIPKESKWDLVKAYFFKNKRGEMDSNSFLEIKPPPITPSTENYEGSSYDDDNTTFQDPLIDDIVSDERIKDAFRELYSPKNLDDLLINNYDNIENATGLSDEDVVEVYNIDIPANLEQQNDKEVSIDKVINVQDFSTITKTLGLLNANELSLDILQNTSSYKTLTGNETTSKIEFERSTDAPQKALEKTHFWQKVYLWPVDGNISKKLTTELKNLFVWKKRSKTIEAIKPSLVLDENVVLNFNSKNETKNSSDYLSVQSGKTTPEYSIGSSSSLESSSLEDLYNSSYVFVVRKDNASATAKKGKWKNIFSRIMHPSKNSKKTNISSLSKEETNRTITQKVIKLPEYLMPEALKEREINVTDDWVFEDSKEIEENTFVEQRSSNGTFLFFFKW